MKLSKFSLVCDILPRYLQELCTILGGVTILDLFKCVFFASAVLYTRMGDQNLLCVL